LIIGDNEYVYSHEDADNKITVKRQNGQSNPWACRRKKVGVKQSSLVLTTYFISAVPFYGLFHSFYWATVCKTVRPMLTDHCPVCDAGVLWPNGWTDQDETWHASRPRPKPHCVR